MSKLVDKERLAKLAQSLDARMKAAVKAENERAVAAENAIDAKAVANAEAIAAINNETNGILAQAKTHVAEREEILQDAIDTKVATADYDAKMTLLDQKDKDHDADILALQGQVTTLEGKMGDKDMAGIQDAIDEFKAEQQGVDSVQDQKIAALEVAVNGDGADVAGLKAEMDAVEGRVQAIEEADFSSAIANEAKARGEEDVKLAGLINGLDGRVAANEAFVAAQPEVDAAQNAKIEALENANKEGGAVANAIKKVADDLAAFEAAQALADAAQNEAIAAKVAQAAYNEKMTALDDEDERIAGLVATEESRAKGVEEGFETRIKANEDKLAIINGEGEGSIAKAKADAMAHAEAKIAELVDSAPDAMNTLNELAEAIKAHGTEYEAYVATVSQNIAIAKQEAITAAASDAASKDAALKSELQAEIDDNVKAEADRAKGEEQAIRNEFAAADTKVLEDAAADAAAKVAVEKGRAEEQEAAIRQEMANEATRVNQKIAADIATESAARVTVENKIREDFVAADSALDGRITTLEGLVVGGEGEGLEAVISDVAKNKQDIKNLQAFEAGHSHEQMIADIAKEVQDRKNAVAKEVEDRDAAIAEALKAYTDTEEMKLILGNIVNSLALSMENNKMVLKLGGTEGIELTSVSLDMVTDDEIDAIINGLDA